MTIKLHYVPLRILMRLIDEGEAIAERLAERLRLSEHLIRLRQRGLVRCDGESALVTDLAGSVELVPTYP